MFTKIYEKIKDFILLNYKFLISLVLLIVLFTYELPFVIYTPGGVVPLEKRIEISDKHDYSGSLNMSYVLVRKGTLPTIVASYLIPDWDLLKKDEITSENENMDELLEKEKLYMASSLDNATILAYKEAGKTINIKNNINNVIYIDKKAKTDILMFDKILEVEGKKINNIEELKEIIKEKNEKDKIDVLVLRDNKEQNCYAEVVKINKELKVGIAFLTTYEYETDPEITIKIKNSESGSSGGLMLSLAIYNYLVDEDITKGRNIVGTGTIDTLGNVGAIDGVKYKMLGAHKNKADIFICPYENYKEAVKVKEKYDLDMEVVGVKTFKEALNYLQK